MQLALDRRAGAHGPKLRVTSTIKKASATRSLSEIREPPAAHGDRRHRPVSVAIIVRVIICETIAEEAELIYKRCKLAVHAVKRNTWDYVTIPIRHTAIESIVT